MFRKLNWAGFWFSRSRLRRGPTLDPRLKDYSATPNIKKQIQQHRQAFERDTTRTFTEVLADPKPKLQQRFKLDTAALNRDIKRVVKQRIKPELLKPAGAEGDDLKFLEEGRSYLHDQRAEVQFQEKFDKQLFMKKETARLLKKEANNHRNFLPGSENNRYNQYLEARNKLKNKRIESMMNYKRNNQELQLLLDSGLMDSPDNIRRVIGQLNQPEGVQQIEERMEDEIKQIQDSKTAIAPKTQVKKGEITLEDELNADTVGPQALRDYSKVEEFMDAYRSSSHEDKLKTAQDVDLLLQVREYERNLFLSRYDQINFRFKGRVRYQNFKEFELLSYIKHEPIEPQELLDLFEQNKEKLSKFNVPVITPAVMSRIYTRTSTYRFAENDENNRINLLAHPSFVALERTLFRELDKISDELYCDAVWTYAKNHEEEEGLLNVPMSNAVQRAIFNEMLERIGRLREDDLGLLVRSLQKMNLVKDDEYKERWGEVVEVLRQRLPTMKESYEYESVMEFVHMLPPTHASIAAIVDNINFFDKYDWEEKGTVLTFTRVCSILLSNSKLIDPLDHNKAFLRLSEIINNKAASLKTIITTLTINEIPKLLVIFAELNKFPMNKEIPPILVNTAKKQVVDSIHMQKHKIYQFTVPTLINTLSAYDYYKNNIKTYSKYIDSSDHLTPYQPGHVGKLVTLKHLLPARTFVFNSKLFFVYHQLAKFMEGEYQALSVKSIAESLYGLSLVQYKNQGIYDSLTFKLLQRIEKQQKQEKREQLTLKQTNELIKIVISFSLQKRNTEVVEQIYDKILKQGKTHLKQIPISILISFFGSYTNIFTLPTQQPKAENQSHDYLLNKWQRNKVSVYLFTALYRDLFSVFLQSLEHEEFITLYIINTHFLNNTSRILENNDPTIQNDFKEINNKLKKNVINLIKIINQIPSQKLKIDYKFAISLCLKLNKQDIKEDIIEGGEFLDFEKLQKGFYDRYIEDILSHEQHVGISVTHKQAYQNLFAKLNSEPSNHPINKKVWTIQLPNKKEAYFIATYEHLMAKTKDSETSLGLFGLWKFYSQIYRRSKWNFNLVCSMLE